MGIQSEITPSERYRVKREARGEKQVLLWMENQMTARLDALVKNGEYRNRSEAVAAAVNKLIEEQN